MKRYEVRTLDDPNEIVSEIEKSPIKVPSRNTGNFSGFGGPNKILDESRMNDLFFDLASKGGERELQKLAELLENDPKANFYDKKDPKHLINRKNFLN